MLVGIRGDTNQGSLISAPLYVLRKGNTIIKKADKNLFTLVKYFDLYYFINDASWCDCRCFVGK